MHEWCYSHTIEYSSAMRLNKLQIYVANVSLNKINQAQEK